MEEKYIITFEDGTHFVAYELKDEDFIHLNDRLITIIRCSDAKELLPTGEWVDLKKW